MKGLGSELIGLTEKISDQNLKGKDLEVLGFAIPSTLEEVGLAGVVISMAKGAKVINDHFFCKAFERFTYELENLTAEDKIKFFNKYSNKNIQEFGEQAILLLNKIEMPLAATLIGRSHRLLVLCEIDSQTYFNYCHIIKNLNQYIYSNLLEVYKESDQKIFKGGVFSLMESLGLMFEVYEGVFASNSPDENNPQPTFTRYMRTDFGEEFYQRILEPYL